MNIEQELSKYIKTADLQGRRIQVIIGEVRTEKLGKDDFKPILYFQGKTKGMVLNKTNVRRIIDAYGPETDHWFGRPLILYAESVDYQGRQVMGLRVLVPPPAAPPAPPAPAPASHVAPATHDQQTGEVFQRPQEPARGGPVNQSFDDIPF